MLDASVCQKAQPAMRCEKAGLDGGHLRAFSLVKPDPTRGSDAPRVEKNDPAYERWFTSAPNILVAQYKNGELTRYVDDPKVATALEEIRTWYTASYIQEIKHDVRWQEAVNSEGDEQSFARALRKAAQHEADRGREDGKALSMDNER
jgi:hypothetical protein